MAEPLTLEVTLDLDAWAQGSGYQDLDGDWHDAPPGPLEYWVANQIVAKLSDRFHPIIQRLVEDKISVLISAKGREAVEQALAGRIRETNSYGEPRGEPRTLLEIITSQIEKTINSRASYDSQTMLQKVIKEQVEIALREAIKPAVDEAKNAAKAALTKRAADMLADEMRRARI